MRWTTVGLAVLTWSAVGLLAAPTTARQQLPAFRAANETVAVYATVQDADGRLVSNLTQADFEIRDEGRPVEITTFSSEIVPITVALLLDMSGSMSDEFLLVRRSTEHFFSTLLPVDRVRLGTFGVEVSLSPHLTGDRAILDRVLAEEVWPGGGTPLWTAIERGITSLASEPGRRVILTLTDGADSCGFGGGVCASRRDVERAALQYHFMLYAIGMPGSELDDGIRSLSERTCGGHFDLAEDDDLPAAFSRVAEELHRQYTLGFTPAKLDGRTHRLEVRMTRPGLTARARESYVAPKERRR
jgi:Ca-activated chloride channel family protein